MQMFGLCDFIITIFQCTCCVFQTPLLQQQRPLHFFDLRAGFSENSPSIEGSRQHRLQSNPANLNHIFQSHTLRIRASGQRKRMLMQSAKAWIMQNHLKSLCFSCCISFSNAVHIKEANEGNFFFSIFSFSDVVKVIGTNITAYTHNICNAYALSCLIASTCRHVFRVSIDFRYYYHKTFIRKRYCVVS